MSRLTSAATIVDVLDPATSEIASGSKMGIDAMKKLPGEGFKRPWPPMIRTEEVLTVAVKAVSARLDTDPKKMANAKGLDHCLIVFAPGSRIVSLDMRAKTTL